LAFAAPALLTIVLPAAPSCGGDGQTTSAAAATLSSQATATTTWAWVHDFKYAKVASRLPLVLQYVYDDTPDHAQADVLYKGYIFKLEVGTDVDPPGHTL
jgi:hypothetical protein